MIKTATKSPMSKMPLPAKNYLNRELSLLAFNRRVLAQAQDERVPLLERLRFLCIVSSNLDEFFVFFFAKPVVVPNKKRGIKIKLQIRKYAAETSKSGFFENCQWHLVCDKYAEYVNLSDIGSNSVFKHYKLSTI